MNSSVILRAVSIGSSWGPAPSHMLHPLIQQCSAGADVVTRTAGSAMVPWPAQLLARWAEPWAPRAETQQPWKRLSSARSISGSGTASPLPSRGKGSLCSPPAQGVRHPRDFACRCRRGWIWAPEQQELPRAERAPTAGGAARTRRAVLGEQTASLIQLMGNCRLQSLLLLPLKSGPSSGQTNCSGNYSPSEQLENTELLLDFKVAPVYLLSPTSGVKFMPRVRALLFTVVPLTNILKSFVGM